MKVAALTSYGPTLASVRGPLLRAMVEAGHQVVASAPDCAPNVISDLEQLGIRYQCLPLKRRGLNPISDIKYCVRVSRFLKAERVDLCFSYTVKPVVFGSLAARRARVPAIASMITGLGFTFMGGSASARLLSVTTKNLYRLALRNNRCVFFQNPDDRDVFIRQKLARPEQCTVVNGSGVDLDHFKPSPVPEGPPAFLMIARLLKAKGIIEFLEAAQRLKAVCPSCRFRLVGREEAGLDAIPLSHIRSWQDRGVLEFVGELWDVRPELERCTVYVLPSYREGTPRSVLEAMACGRPIITTDVPGCKETVAEAVNGFLVPARDSVALEQAMRRFVERRELAPKMGRESRRIAVEKYDVRMINRLMLQRMGLLESA